MSANNSTVEFFVGEEVPLRDGISKETIVIGDGRTLNTFLFDTTTEELGTTLTMSTFINEDNTVTMEIDAEISSIILNFSSVTTVDDGGNMVEFALDGISKSEIKSIVTTKSGQTIALGGIIRETIQSNEKQIPILGDIPVLGFLFKQKWDETRKTETVIVLTPHIINHPGFSGEATTRFLNRKSSNKKIIDHTEKLLTD
jgi:type II secretory pathway component GspD/PulD (secretin)